MRTCLHVALVLVPALALLAAGCGEKPVGDRGESTEPTPAARIVNTTCPVMDGNPVDADNVPASLVVEFEGRKVGFCCGGCLSKWNSWTDEKKRERLNASLGNAPGGTGGSP